MTPSGVICCWAYEDNAWQLKESYTIDENGHCLTEPSTGGGRRAWDKWLNKVEDDYLLYETIMGRAVTYWDVISGIRLIGFHPPICCKWISLNFYDQLKKSENWQLMIEGGYELYFGTEKEVMKYITIRSKPNARTNK